MISVQTGFLEGKQAIMDYLKCGDDRFQYFLENGMPVRIVGNRYLAHKNNLERFLIGFTDNISQKTKERRTHKSI